MDHMDHMAVRKSTIFVSCMDLACMEEDILEINNDLNMTEAEDHQIYDVQATDKKYTTGLFPKVTRV
jgi:hypothetical protein